ncbi:hypothetical protein CF319_g4539 [Tilletia indica]|uniref:Uncharacterized protein n=1 Tax=Tilletia indica TaxID=43049 RepID=A0A177TFI7_9BASI|nr:hypothetical protein CF319_g4539 [Tilletia indica]KAE8254170.1 hypothetical protein A4X13_0g3516 [Tilletia indica]
MSGLQERDCEKAALLLSSNGRGDEYDVRAKVDMAEEQRTTSKSLRSLRIFMMICRSIALVFMVAYLVHLPVTFFRSPDAHVAPLGAAGFTTFPHPANASYPPVPHAALAPLAPWKQCPGHEHEPFECSYIRVPKDYFDKSKGHAYVAVSKYPATARGKDFRGAIFLNPGGPGGSGIKFSYRFAQTLSILFKGRYHIIGFDPRGIGATRPIVDCFGSTRAFQLFKAGTALERAFDVAPDTFSEEGRQTLLRQWTEAQALKHAEMEICNRTMGDELRYMGTGTVVRDISYMNFEGGLGEGRPINFIGYSYGTILGAYLVNMLPASSLGNVVIDGVASAPGWSSMPPERWLPSGWMVDTEKAYNWAVKECSEVGPELCAVAQEKGEDPQKITDRLMAFFDELYKQPLAVPYGPRPGMLTSGIARAMLYLTTNAPSLFPTVASFLAEAMAGNGTQLYRLAIQPFSTDLHEKSQMDLSRVAVSCGDAPPYEDPKAGNWPKPSPELLLNLTLDNFKNYTPHFAASAPSIEPDGGCEWHPASGRTPDRFTGPWNNTLKTPMLIISNTADPITPRSSGEEIHKLMGNSSGLLIVNTPGHCSLAGVSRCSFQTLQDYFLNDKLPEEGKLCERDEGIFGEPLTTKLGGELSVEKEDELLSLARVAKKQWAEHRRASFLG